MATVLVPFPFAGNGFTVEHLNVGDERDFGSATEGLKAAGLISVEPGAVKAEQDAPTVVVSTQTASRKPFQKRR